MSLQKGRKRGDIVAWSLSVTNFLFAGTFSQGGLFNKAAAIGLYETVPDEVAQKPSGGQYVKYIKYINLILKV